MKYNDEQYKSIFVTAMAPYGTIYAQALLAAESECERLREQVVAISKNMEEYFHRSEKRKQKLTKALQKIHDSCLCETDDRDVCFGIAQKALENNHD